MRLHPSATPGFVRHVEARRDRLRTELPPLIAGAQGPITLEIGCGHGHFLVSYAAAHPGEFCLGIDLLAKRLEKAARKLVAAEIPNVRFHRAEALELLECLPAATRFRNVFLLFPDPWPKKRHHKNRIMNPGFLATLAARMTSGGKLFFRTDHAEYFAAARMVLDQHSSWRLAPDAPWPFEEPTVFQKKAPAYQSLVAEVSL